MKKVIVSFLVLLSMVFFFVSGKGYASEVSPESLEITQQQNLEGQILSHYISVKEKDGIFHLEFKNKKHLNQVLEYVHSNYSVKDVEEFVNKTNELLLHENGNGDLTNYLKALKNNSLIIKDKHTNYSGFRSACSWTFFGVGTAHSLLYASAAAALGVTGVGAVMIPALVGIAYGAAGAAVC